MGRAEGVALYENRLLQQRLEVPAGLGLPQFVAALGGEDPVTAQPVLDPAPQPLVALGRGEVGHLGPTGLEGGFHPGEGPGEFGQVGIADPVRTGQVRRGAVILGDQNEAGDQADFDPREPGPEKLGGGDGCGLPSGQWRTEGPNAAKSLIAAEGSAVQRAGRHRELRTTAVGVLRVGHAQMDVAFIEAAEALIAQRAHDALIGVDHSVEPTDELHGQGLQHVVIAIPERSSLSVQYNQCSSTAVSPPWEDTP